jgi:low affinity Fe/Cu permease
MSQSAQLNFFTLNYKELKALKYFWIGFILYTLGYTFSSVNITYLVCQPMQILGMVLFVGSSVFLVHFRFENKYLRVVYILYLVWLVTIVVRGFEFRLSYVEFSLYQDYLGVFPYFAPLILLFPQTIFSFQKIFNVTIVLGVICVLMEAVFVRQLMNRDITDITSKAIMENVARHLAFPSTFLLLTYSYQSKKIKILALVVSMLTLLFAIIRARRGLIFTIAIPMAFAYMISLLASKKRASIILASLFAALLMGVYGLQFFSQSSLFSSLKSRADEDTRSGVEDCFRSDMKTSDWIIGKGINGQYYCPGVDVDSTTGYRSVIETDYENVILKGGLISLSLLLLITLPAAIKGIFYSKNILTRAAGFWILAWILSLYPSTGVVFTINYLILWLCVAICYNKGIRELPEDLMKFYFSGTKSISKDII